MNEERNNIHGIIQIFLCSNIFHLIPSGIFASLFHGSQCGTVLTYHGILLAACFSQMADIRNVSQKTGKEMHMITRIIWKSSIRRTETHRDQDAKSQSNERL